jgi:hypothetical protein
MKKIALGLTALLLMAAAATPGVAQDAAVAAHSAGCAEHFGCLKYGTLTPAQARTCRGHPQFVEAQSAAAVAPQSTEQASRVVVAARR